ncbi:hypothetical protein AIOL_002287 [Candidatus Rhodobacter oscarellae]|uniref:Uncharacterized protein n=1 Tax=Candidatus Rhodobacter oscarellae TaxID=1675527 RepID=A0A0J9E3H1_9RHOB|nr:hypothetical protein AIOL_002287 [Candidatus Rhodobacter lobularis]
MRGFTPRTAARRVNLSEMPAATMDGPDPQLGAVREGSRQVAAALRIQNGNEKMRGFGMARLAFGMALLANARISSARALRPILM